MIEYWYHRGFEKGDKVVILPDIGVHNLAMLRKNLKRNTIPAGTRCVIESAPSSFSDGSYSVTLIDETNGIPSGSVIRGIPEYKMRTP
ncbi:hypothetical protein LCGC14_1409680 [marine sediment metagenome]|uniref:Uncharacterized protein n=1 Tax=marine sediment metagenome TaxID=412755 RepID=A0A0F9MA19_9ZZZZ